MKADSYQFGSVVIDGKTYEKDIIIHNGSIEKRKKKASKPYKARYGHTPLTSGEKIPWDKATLIIGTGAHEKLPITDNVYETAQQKGVTIKPMKTPEALEHLNDPDTNLILHLTC